MDRYIHAVYCDDVRFELGGKASFMGCYDAAMIVPSFPVTLRNFVVFVTVVTPIDEPFEFLTLELRNGDEVLASHELNPSEMSEDENDGRTGPFTVRKFTAWFPFSPFTIQAPTFIRAVALCETGEMRSMSLEVMESK